MKRIDSDHLKKFYVLLSEISNFFPLDLDNIRSVIEGNGKSCFQSPDKSGLILAVESDIRDRCFPMVPVVSVTSAPNHLSEHAGILELKIMNSQAVPGANFITWLSMFPSGRVVFGMDGANLDSNGKKIFVNESAIKLDDKFYGDNELVRKLRYIMARSFNSKEQTALDAKRKVLKALSNNLPEFNN